MRIIAFCAIMLLAASSAYAQEKQQKKIFVVPPLSAPADATSFNALGNTPPGKKDLTHQIVFPKNMTRDEAIDACAKELAEFLKHKFPDQVELEARVATCVVPEDDKS